MLKEQRRLSANARGHAAAVRAGLVRITLALVGALTSVEIEGLSGLTPYLWGYLALSLGMQLLIYRRLGEHMARAVIMGIADLGVLTAVSAALGSATTAAAFLYLLIPVTYATTSTRKQLSITIAAAASVAYLGVLFAEYFGLLPRPRPSNGGTPAIAMMVTAVLVVFSIGATTRLVGQLISALGNANHRLRELSQRDELSQLHNRRYLLHRMHGELARVGRGAHLAVVMVDLDGFKRVNDEEGHEAGDHLLVQMARGLERATRASDVVTRYGGDEFVVLLTDTTREGADAVAARIVDNAREVGRSTYPGIPVTASVGVAVASVGESAAELLKRADACAYAAKRAGGDRVCFA